MARTFHFVITTSFISSNIEAEEHGVVEEKIFNYRIESDYLKAEGIILFLRENENWKGCIVGTPSIHIDEKNIRIALELIKHISLLKKEVKKIKEKIRIMLEREIEARTLSKEVTLIFNETDVMVITK